MAKAISFANALLDAVYNNGSNGTVSVGALTLTLPLKCRFLTTASTAATAGSDWATSGGYTTGGVSVAGAFATAAANGSKSNTAAISVTNAPAGTWAGNEIWDGTNRLNFAAITGGSKTVNAGDGCTIGISSLVGTES